MIDHPAGTFLRVTNQTGAPIKVRYRAWTPGDCGASPPMGVEPSDVIAPGKSIEWSGDVPHPIRGPIIGGVEVWSHPCDESCPDPPDAFTSFILPPGP